MDNIDENAADAFRVDCKCLPACTSLQHDGSINHIKYDLEIIRKSIGGTKFKWDNNEWNAKRTIVTYFVIVVSDHLDWPYISVAPKLEQWNAWKSTISPIFYQTVAVYSGYFWVSHCWAWLSLFISSRFDYSGRFDDRLLKISSYLLSKLTKICMHIAHGTQFKHSSSS